MRKKNSNLNFKVYSLLIFLFLIITSQISLSQTNTDTIQNETSIFTPIKYLLNGEYAFAVDYANAGEAYEWYSPNYKDEIWDRVNVPHVWSLDQRFPYFEGTGWYRKYFSVPKEFKNKHVRLIFDAVYSKSSIWLNGKKLATHNGGYTPFEIDVSSYLDFKNPNLLVVKANNNINRKPNANPQLVRAWMEDGGIIRDVYLKVNSKVYIVNQKIITNPNLQTGEATLHISSWVRNTKSVEDTVSLNTTILKEKEPLYVSNKPDKYIIKPNAIKRFDVVIKLSKEMVKLWSLNSPILYNLITTIEGIESAEPVLFGIRKFETKGSTFLLNGYPIRIGGANRVASGTGFAHNDPYEFVEKDLRLMKEAGLEFMRMHHVPLSKSVLDWADRNGMLLIEECATPTNLFSDSANNLDSINMKEMIERDWNHPSIVAWSIGNEYESETTEGIKWSKEMKDFVLSIDSSRLICFASNRAAKQNLKPNEEASSIMDFVCLNTYGSTPEENAANIDRAHQRWPQKPFIITEFGYRADRVGQEKDRELWFKEMFKIIRDRSFISGASVWSFNDYRSRYISTNPDGFRWWGLVDANRNLRGSYSLFKSEFTPFIIRHAKISNNIIIVKLEIRNDFPVYPPTLYNVSIESFNFRGRSLGVQSYVTKLLGPGDEIELRFPVLEEATYFRGQIEVSGFVKQIFGPTTWSSK